VAQQAYDQDPAFLKHQADVQARADFEAKNPRAPKSPADLAAEQAAIDAEIKGGNLAARKDVRTGNAAERAREAQGIKDNVDANLQLPHAKYQADEAAALAKRQSGEANWKTTALAGTAAAGAGQALVPATEAVGRGVAATAGATADAVKRAVGSTPAPDYLQIAKDYMPAVAIVGATAALAMWLMSRDDDENEKTAAVIDDDTVARAARNRRRLEGLLARNPKALDGIGRIETALHDLPVRLDATKRAALLNKTP
jgi:hypothetical protein